jgi:hypothetical protein
MKLSRCRFADPARSLCGICLTVVPAVPAKQRRDAHSDSEVICASGLITSVGMAFADPARSLCGICLTVVPAVSATKRRDSHPDNEVSFAFGSLTSVGMAFADPARSLCGICLPATNDGNLRPSMPSDSEITALLSSHWPLLLLFVITR